MFTKSLWVVGAAAATLATCGAASAQSTSTTQTTITTTSVSIPDITYTSDVPLEKYQLLSNHIFDGMDLAQAHAEGFSDRQIAIMAKIADRACVPFETVKTRALDGATFKQIAEDHGLPVTDSWYEDNYRDMVSDYRMAWDHTGRKEVRELVAGSEQTYIAPTSSTTTTTTTTTTPMNNMSSPSTTMPMNNNMSTPPTSSTTPSMSPSTTPNNGTPSSPSTNNLNTPTTPPTTDNGTAPSSTTPATPGMGTTTTPATP